MRRIDDGGDGLMLQIIRKTVDAAESADTDGHGAGSSIVRSPCERKHRRDARHTSRLLRKASGLARSSEEEKLERFFCSRVHDESPMP